MVKNDHECDDKGFLLKHKHCKIQQTSLHIFKVVSHARKQSNLRDFLNQNENKGMPISKSKS
jgi:hypothetical protein